MSDYCYGCGFDRPSCICSDRGLDMETCPACDVPTPVSEMTQRYGVRLCEDCAQEQYDQRIYEEQQLSLSLPPEPERI